MANDLKQTIMRAVMQRFAHSTERRDEALHEVLRLTHAHLPDADRDTLTTAVPSLPLTLYEKWAGLFAERLLETVSHSHIREMCSGTRENEATLALVFVMFMESERMEKIVAQDIKNFNETME